jgi:5'-nucleotidase
MLRTRLDARRAAALAVTATAALLVTAGSILPATGTVPAPAAAPAARPGLDGLRVLVTNDDSMQASNDRNSDGLGLYELRRALCDAGADVVVIAPWQVQSGRGTAVSNSGTFHLGQVPVPDGNEGDCADAPSGAPVIGLCLDTAPCSASSPSATPVDTVKFATRGGLEHVAGWEEEPDLVVSGINSGLNIASSVSDSGTVGAALAGIEHDIPAVAFSTEFNSDFVFPLENYRATAEWGAEFLSALHAKGLLLQHKFAVNVNYPNIADGDPARRARWTSVGTQTYAYHSYIPEADGSFTISLGQCSGVPACEEDRDDSDVEAVIGKNHIAITPLTWDRTYGIKIDGHKELAKLRHFVNHHAPRP